MGEELGATDRPGGGSDNTDARESSTEPCARHGHDLEVAAVAMVLAGHGHGVSSNRAGPSA